MHYLADEEPVYVHHNVTTQEQRIINAGQLSCLEGVVQCKQFLIVH